ncbi:solute carrier organic anion transporter family member 74D-like [Belonocnema kinseyi]|uniref:solute carrier organic anion transporter family member 74D-like n=1 Tax=Belonocnema kinseyi TaxID=2817044 RepID=UPI00143D4328|nr:solute carrier organic anion transporter family member 74D-like [Belonocnema kinseyi]
MDQASQCGLCGFFPKWLQTRATAKVFILVYGLLGTIQSMAHVYINITLTTIEKRFKIPSRTTGIILSGNDIAHILSIFLTYYGGSGNRPRWIAIGVGLSAASCIVLALPHFIYGSGKDALALTQEYLDQNLLNVTENEDLPICFGNQQNSICDLESLQDMSILPRMLVFLSQVILGFGTTLYFGLGQAYMDDNTKKKNTPMLLGLLFALRTSGTFGGFILGFSCLNLYIDPTLHPVISKDDPRWLGAWWLGWIILGTTMGALAFFIAMFPRNLPKQTKSITKGGEEPLKCELPQQKNQNSKETTNSYEKNKEMEYKPSMKDFIITMKRLLMNPILAFNNLSSIFFILGAAGHFTFMSKYVEVVFGVSAADNSMISGPISIAGMIIGFIVSGAVISKFKPGAGIILFWNIIIGFLKVFGDVAFIFLGCDGTPIQGIDYNSMEVNLLFPCNANCHCEGVKYFPVCHKPTMTTFFSACHAGCNTVLPTGGFGNCSCITDQIYMENSSYASSVSISPIIDKEFYDITNIIDEVITGACRIDCKVPYMTLTIIMCITRLFACSGRIGNILVNYRCVEDRDKALAQGITMMVLSIFAFIPGPIIYGALIDSTCLVWNDACGTKGNCWVHEPETFRNYLNITAICFAMLGVIFDVAMWHVGKNVELYGEEEEDTNKDFINSLPLEKSEKSKDKKHENITEENNDDKK